MRPEDLDGRAVALLFMYDVDEGNEDMRVLQCRTRFSDGEVIAIHGPQCDAFPLNEEWLERVHPVPEDLRAILQDAEFFLPLTIGPLPDDVDADKDCRPLGLSWDHWQSGS